MEYEIGFWPHDVEMFPVRGVGVKIFSARREVVEKILRGWFQECFDLEWISHFLEECVKVERCDLFAMMLNMLSRKFAMELKMDENLMLSGIVMYRIFWANVFEFCFTGKSLFIGDLKKMMKFRRLIKIDF